ncbi:unnamed protein product [Caenorhabditis angaria]|uniref:WW domain-containing protein n=1 Tax=Caenorhabditis angaria TaxID=860376 RepID=A0A9P1I410_9PELO|nr:unnamed protein product [Caenorhabditis angaria]
MADVWVSTGKRFCEICKVWFGNNKISQDHHERGERHKAMLQQKIRETMQKGKRQEIADAKLSATLARMESAATSSMAAKGEGVMMGPSVPATGLRMNIFDPKQHKDVGSMAREMASRREGNLKRKGLSGAECPTQAPSLKVTKDDVVSAYRDLTAPSAHGPALPENLAVNYLPDQQVQCGEIKWVRAKSERGTYYWNIFDQSTRWDQPSFFYTEQEYEEKCREFEENRAKNYYGLDDVTAVRQGKQEVEAYIKEMVSASGLNNEIEKNRKELNIVDKPDKKTKAERRRQWEERKKQREEARARGEDFEKKYEEEDIDEIPLPKTEQEVVSEEFEEFAPPPPPVFEEEEVEEKYEVQQRQEEPEPESSSAAPYGAWVRIKKEDKPEIPFESPLTARFREEEEKAKEEEEWREKEEPKIEFGEKTATTMTKKVKGPIEFKKKTTTRNIRKREEN